MSDEHPLRDVLTDLNRERYRTPHWWATPPSGRAEGPGSQPNFDDSDVACARRRRAMADDFDKLRTREAL